MITFQACADCDCRLYHHQEDEKAHLQERQEELDALMTNKPADLKDFSMKVAQLSVLCPVRAAFESRQARTTSSTMFSAMHDHQDICTEGRRANLHLRTGNEAWITLIIIISR